MTRTIYEGRSMPIDESKPVHTYVYGETESIAKAALREETKDAAPVAVYRVDWENDWTHAETSGWKFVLWERELYEEDDL